MKVQEWSQSDVGMFCYKTKMRDGVQWLAAQIIKQKVLYQKETVSIWNDQEKQTHSENVWYRKHSYKKQY